MSKYLQNTPGPAAFPPIAVMTWLKNVAIVCSKAQSNIKSILANWQVKERPMWNYDHNNKIR